MSDRKLKYKAHWVPFKSPGEQWFGVRLYEGDKNCTVTHAIACLVLCKHGLVFDRIDRNPTHATYLSLYKDNLDDGLYVLVTYFDHPEEWKTSPSRITYQP